ncbi:MAG TPA: DUF1360 domain-containing protein [Anaerolineae bacterium]|nr:DUF1360 domain-containing protein [Anaerolineae bacterium]
MATWRLSSLLANEDGPFGILASIRQASTRFTDLLICVWCVSVWIGLALALLYWYSPALAFWLCLPFALSAGAIAWDKWNG